MPNYTLPDGETVKNKLGAWSHDEVETREVDFVRLRQNEHLLNPPIPRTFDGAHLKAIHHQLFQDVYEWVGHTRDERVALSDGTTATEPLLLRPGSKPFASGAQISERLESLSTQLREADYLRGLPEVNSRPVRQVCLQPSMESTPSGKATDEPNESSCRSLPKKQDIASIFGWCHASA